MCLRISCGLCFVRYLVERKPDNGLRRQCGRHPEGDHDTLNSLEFLLILGRQIQMKVFRLCSHAIINTPS